MSMPVYAVDRKRWSNMTILEQMGNIYSEVGRSLNAKRHNKSEDSNFALVRALDLFDATVEDLVSQKSPRVREVLRAKDQYLHAVYDSPLDLKSVADIDRYFMQYALAARMQR